jgi:hypothetical protein
MPMGTNVRHLRVLIANEKRERLELLAQVVIGLGHDVIAREISVKEVGSATGEGAAGRCDRRARSLVRACARVDRGDRSRGFVSGDRFAACERSGVHP